jgi:hypothetical protein
MPTQATRPKYEASFTFRGFSLAPQEVEALVGLRATLGGVAGALDRGSKAPLKRSFVQWSVEFPENARVNEMIALLIEKLGGFEHIASVAQRVSPEETEVDLTLRVKDSEEQEGGFIEATTIAGLARISATLSVGIYRRVDA